MKNKLSTPLNLSGFFLLLAVVAAAFAQSADTETDAVELRNEPAAVEASLETSVDVESGEQQADADTEETAAGENVQGQPEPAAETRVDSKTEESTTEEAKPVKPDSGKAVAAVEEEIPYSKDGADSCLKCHDEDSEFPVMSIFRTKHGQRADERTPFAQLQCESCHGPGGEHAKRIRRGEERPPILNFGRKAKAPAAEQNAMCLNCHQDYARMGWQGSVHERNDVACASCHTIHTHRDPVSIASEQPEVCFDCHKKERADIYKASSHPIRYGKMTCSDCHEPHDSNGPSLLTHATLNETCYTCHAEKRGPYLWEHPPAVEDCSLCHNPHGSNHMALLNKRAPLLCQDCHSRLGHPSVQRTANGLAGNMPSAYLLSGSCMNCHSQVHGSNHPSGSDLNR